MKIQQILASAQRASLMQQAAPKIPPELMQQQASGMNGMQQMYPGMAQQFGTGAGNLSPRTGAAGIFGATAASNSFSGSSLTFSPSAPSKFTPSRCQVERGFVVQDYLHMTWVACVTMHSDPWTSMSSTSLTWMYISRSVIDM